MTDFNHDILDFMTMSVHFLQFNSSIILLTQKAGIIYIVCTSSGVVQYLIYIEREGEGEGERNKN